MHLIWISLLFKLCWLLATVNTLHKHNSVTSYTRHSSSETSSYCSDQEIANSLRNPHLHWNVPMRLILYCITFSLQQIWWYMASGSWMLTRLKYIITILENFFTLSFLQIILSDLAKITAQCINATQILYELLYQPVLAPPAAECAFP